MRNRGLLGAGIALAMALGGVQAHAQFFGPYPPGAFYLGPEGGWTKLQSQTNTLTIRNGRGTESVSHSVTGNFDSGFNAGVRAGYMWGPWRFEEEYSYRFNSLSSLSPLGGYVQGNTHSNAIMTNALFDFTLGWPITPHIGGGVGAVNVDTGASTTSTIAVPTGPTTGVLVSPRISANRWEFGYQGIAGIRYLINPALALDIDYRYFATPSFTTTQYRLAPVHGACCYSASFSSRVQSQNVVASITMLFGAPPPAAPPPAPAAPPPPPTHQVYLVFFDWDKYNITPEGMQILEAAAAHWKAGGAVQIQVTGYTDLTGSAGYNQRLSERRAGAVAAVLERLGIPRSDMAVAGRGMNDPRVPTPLGVREPQNRRVEIVFP